MLTANENFLIMSSDPFSFPLPKNPTTLKYTFVDKQGLLHLISLNAAQLQQVSWYGFFANIKKSLTGKLMNSYLSDDYALQLMVLGDSAKNGAAELNPAGLLQNPAVYRTEFNIFNLPDLPIPRVNMSSSYQYASIDPPAGATFNPTADVNFDDTQTNWRVTVLTYGGLGAHGDFRDLNYPEIWTWWSQFLTANAAMAIGKERQTP